MKLPVCVLLTILLAGLLSEARAQDTATQSAPAGSGAREPGQLSAQQSVDFAQARQDFAAGKWAAAAATLKDLHEHHPRNAEVAKFAAEAAMNIGEATYAESAMKAILNANPDDWQAHILLARSYAQQSRAAERDAELALIVKMHANTADPVFQKHGPFLIEKIALQDGGSLELYYSLVPSSRFHVYEMGQFLDANGKKQFRITLESDDIDQAMWAQKHPKEAAAGERMYSMDSYSERVVANGQMTQTHGTLAFFDGRPGYDVVKAKMLGDHTPTSSSTVPFSKP